MKTKLIIALAALVFVACKKEPKEPDDDNNNNNNNSTPTATVGSLKIEFEAKVGDSAFVLNTKNYTNTNGDTFNISTFKYYVSNVVLTKTDNSTFSVPNSYYLIDHGSGASFSLAISNIPVADYKAITFLIGVDSTRNVSGAQSGDLDPGKGMFWSWSSGYIMAKLEGNSPQSGASNKKLTFHVGGFSGTNSVLKTVSPTFGSSTAKVKSDKTPEIHIITDVSEWFKTPNTIGFGSTHTVHMPGAMAKSIADNYADMFKVDHIHN